MLKTSADVPHVDPTHPAVAAILAFDLDAHSGHDTIAAELAPHVAAAPAIREWSEDDEWTAAEQAVSAARLFVEGAAATEVENEIWRLNEHQVDRLRRLRRMQMAHRESVVRDRLGDFPGYRIIVHDWMPFGMRVEVYEPGASLDTDLPIIAINPDEHKETTRREVELSIDAWKAGHERGLREGAERIRKGMKALLEIEPA